MTCDNGCRQLSPTELREGGRCPLTPEEAALMLSALGYKHDAYIYLAGSQTYGAQSRLQPLTNLYPNLVTKEDLLTPTELAPFRNFSSQVIPPTPFGVLNFFSMYVIENLFVCRWQHWISLLVQQPTYLP